MPQRHSPGGSTEQQPSIGLLNSLPGRYCKVVATEVVRGELFSSGGGSIISKGVRDKRRYTMVIKASKIWDLLTFSGSAPRPLPRTFRGSTLQCTRIFLSCVSVQQPGRGCCVVHYLFFSNIVVFTARCSA